MKIAKDKQSLSSSDLSNVEVNKDIDNKVSTLADFIIERIQFLLKQRNISRYKLAKTTQITQATLSTILRGKNMLRRR